MLNCWIIRGILNISIFFLIEHSSFIFYIVSSIKEQILQPLAVE